MNIRNSQSIGEVFARPHERSILGLTKAAPLRKLRYRWTCTVAAQNMGDFLVMPLASSKELASEGWHMQHCVATYDAQCAKGLYQVFSVRDLLGNRVATLGLTYSADSWKMDQCLGIGNAEVMLNTAEWIHDNGKHESMDEYTELHYLAHDMVRLLNASAQ